MPEGPGLLTYLEQLGGRAGLAVAAWAPSVPPRGLSVYMQSRVEPKSTVLLRGTALRLGQAGRACGGQGVGGAHTAHPPPADQLGRLAFAPHLQGWLPECDLWISSVSILESSQKDRFSSPTWTHKAETPVWASPLVK